MALYDSHYGALDEARLVVERMPVGQIFNCAEHLKEDLVRRSAYYQEYLIPRGVRHIMSAGLMSTDRLIAGCGLQGSTKKDHFGPENMQRFERMQPHLRRVVRLNHHLRGIEHDYRRAHGALDRLAMSIIVVDEFQRVRLANTAAEGILSQCDGLTIVSGRLYATGPDSNGRLDAAIRATVTTAVRTAGAGGQALRIPRPSGKAPWIVLTTPVPARSALAQGSAPGALILISDPEKVEPVPGRRLIELYGLTQTEAAVALDLLNGLSPNEIAETRAVSITTVRAQISAVLAKTGTRRQSELLRLLAGLPPVAPL
jgi:DNA-binding CsgD family transcriptional regulator